MEIYEPAIDREDIECAHAGGPCSPVVGDCLCRCAECAARRDEWDGGPFRPNGWEYVESSRRSFCAYDLDGIQMEPGETVYRIEPIDLADAVPLHACPVAEFFDDPITQPYGLGGDWDEWSRVVKCPVCEEAARDGEEWLDDGEPRHPDAYDYGEPWGPDNPAPGSPWS